MSRFCTWSDGEGPVCFEVTEQEKTNVDTLKLLTSGVFITTLVGIVFLHGKTGTEKKFLMAAGALTLILFLWSVVYETRLIARSKLVWSPSL
jgi:hypothetical protein